MLEHRSHQRIHILKRSVILHFDIEHASAIGGMKSVAICPDLSLNLGRGSTGNEFLPIRMDVECHTGFLYFVVERDIRIKKADLRPELIDAKINISCSKNPAK